MSVPSDLFGIAYLDVESFRSAKELFGVEMSFAVYDENTTDGDDKLNRVLQAASRGIDAYCGQTFTPGDITEQHAYDPNTWQFPVNNPPVTGVSACLIRFGITSTITVPIGQLYINNQKGYIEIAQGFQAVLVASLTPLNLIDPQIEITYKSLQSVPNAVKLATGYQAGHLINSGFVDTVLAPNFGALDIGGLTVNNKKGGQSVEARRSATLSADAERLLQPYQQFVAA